MADEFNVKFRGEYLPVDFEAWHGEVERWSFADGVEREVTEEEDHEVRQQIVERNWDGN